MSVGGELTPPGLAWATPRRGAASIPAGVIALTKGSATKAAVAIIWHIDFLIVLVDRAQYLS